MFRILILQRYYDVSDGAIEYAILDRLSFKQFLGLGINNPVPDPFYPDYNNLIKVIRIETIVTMNDS